MKRQWNIPITGLSLLGMTAAFTLSVTMQRGFINFCSAYEQKSHLQTVSVKMYLILDFVP
jgi:hypothetical protein